MDCPSSLIFLPTFLAYFFFFFSIFFFFPHWPSHNSHPGECAGTTVCPDGCGEIIRKAFKEEGVCSEGCQAGAATQRNFSKCHFLSRGLSSFSLMFSPKNMAVAYLVGDWWNFEGEDQWHELFRVSPSIKGFRTLPVHIALIFAGGASLLNLGVDYDPRSFLHSTSRRTLSICAWIHFSFFSCRCLIALLLLTN